VRYYRALALAAHAEIGAGHEPAARETVRREDHNLRAAIRWSLANEARLQTLELVPAVAAAWYVSGSFAEVVDLCSTVLDGDPGGDARLRGWTHYGMVWASFLGGDPESAFSANRQALAHAEESGDSALEALACASQAHMIFLGTGDTDAAMPWYERSLALCERHRLTTLKSFPLMNAAMALIGAERELDRARAMIEEGEELAREAGDDYRLAHLSMDRWMLALTDSDWAAVLEAAEQSRRRSRRARSTIFEQMSMVGTGAGRLGLGEVNEAEGAFLSAARLALHDGNLLQLGPALQGLSAIAAVRKEHVRAARLWGASLSLVGLFPMVSRSYDRYLRASRVELGGRWDRECELGRALAAEDAVDLALDSP
jgi:tetratricopeptide (TPR) repeat protein